jgi:hypothetical protein
VRETDEPPGATDQIARYEQLRAQALDGAPDGWRLGLAVLEHRGVVAWARAWQATAPAPDRAGAAGPVRASDELVGALASMALECVRGR